MQKVALSTSNTATVVYIPAFELPPSPRTVSYEMCGTSMSRPHPPDELDTSDHQSPVSSYTNGAQLAAPERNDTCR